MMPLFAIDLLTVYGIEDLPAHQEVINPVWQELTKQRNSIQHFENQLHEKKAEIKETPRRIPLENLKEDDTFQQLVPERKHLLDAVKLKRCG